jgi:hypothetical protein
MSKYGMDAIFGQRKGIEAEIPEADRKGGRGIEADSPVFCG